MRSIAVASRSHRDSETDDYLEQFNINEFIAAGSSLKFCLIAAGEADIYPRFGPTTEWDIAAGHAGLNAAGGSVIKIGGEPFVCCRTETASEKPAYVARG